MNAIAGNVNIGDGVSSAGTATLKLLANEQIANTSVVTINSDGVFAVNDKTETINGLE